MTEYPATKPISGIKRFTAFRLPYLAVTGKTVPNT